MMKMAFECTVNNSMNGILQTTRLSRAEKKLKKETKWIFVFSLAKKDRRRKNTSKEVNTITKGMK